MYVNDISIYFPLLSIFPLLSSILFRKKKCLALAPCRLQDFPRSSLQAILEKMSGQQATTGWERVGKGWSDMDLK